MAILEWSGPLDVESFLARGWQKRPVLFRDAIRNWRMPIGVPELFALAEREELPSRWIGLPDSDRGWQVRRGPFPPDFRASLPESGWTLLVQEIDRHLESFATLLERFRFVPNWRIDDAMLSYATDGAGVGPHIDRYDVFLIQVEGRRRWRIADSPVEYPPLRPDTPLPVLQEFAWDREWILEPGDLLYLPPGIPHEGVAVGPGFTCSIGFRAPDPRELLSGFLRTLAPSEFERTRYRDPDLGEDMDRSAGEIPRHARDRLRASAVELFESEDFDRWIGRMITTPHRNSGPRGAASRLGAEGWLRELIAGRSLRRSSPAHFCWLREADGKIRMFVGGESYLLGRRAEPTAEAICGRAPLDIDTLRPLLERGRMVRILTDLVARGFLTFVDVR